MILIRYKKVGCFDLLRYEGFLANAENVNVKNFYVALIHAEKGYLEIAEGK